MNIFYEVDMTVRRIRSIACSIILVFFPLLSVKCADSLYYAAENFDAPVVSLTKAGNNVVLSQGFFLAKDMKIRVVSIGEGVYDDLTDFGWIIDADSRKKIWVMDIEHSKHAGGAKKNRIADEVLLLKRGNYIAYYKTDDSHSYKRWNDLPPGDAESWGLSLIIENDNKRFVTLFDDEDFKSINLVAEIVHVRNNDFISRAFKLNTETKLNIYTIGEGIRSEMFDYGWIEGEAGNIIWKMDYKKTKYAGGAVKNRLAEDAIILPAGEYRVYYKTDDSHSYDSWNANPPEDAVRYGITITTDEAILAGKDKAGTGID